MVERPAFPFFLGCGRSGTTLVRVMFDAHPDLAIPPGCGLVRRLGNQRERYETSSGFDLERFETDVLNHERFPSWEVDPAILGAALRELPPVDLPDAFRRVYTVYADAQGKPRYGNKTHSYVLAIPLLAELFPEAKFVHIVRDGRNTALSLIEAPFGPTTVEGAARFWRYRVEQARSDGMRLGSDRYREVHYEDIVSDPRGALRPLCDFLGLAFDESMLRYYEREGGPARGLKFPQIHTHLTKPPTKNIRDWRDQLKGKDLVRFESIAGPTLERFGYERTASIPMGLRVEERLRTTFSASRRQFHGIRRKVASR